MARGKKLTSFQCGKVTAYRDSGMSLRKIANKIGKSTKCIQNFFKNPARYQNKSPAKRPKIISSSVQRRMIRAVKADRTVTSAELKSDLNIAASERTVRRYLNGSGFKKIKKDKVPLITATNKTRRLRFGNQNKEWDEEWKKIIFSDDKKFNLDGPDGYKKYWHDSSVNQKQTYSTRPSGGGGVMMWGAVAYNGKMELQEVSGRMNAEGYVRMLENAKLKDEGRRLVGSDWVFQQDNAPCHRANYTKIFFAQEGINVLDWPANSPDLNLIENVWAYLVQAVYKGGRHYSSVNMLKAAIVREWRKMPQSYVQELYKTMKNRVREVLLNRGGPTSY